jgi:hypothetical protein
VDLINSTVLCELNSVRKKAVPSQEVESQREQDTANSTRRKVHAKRNGSRAAQKRQTRSNKQEQKT